MNPRDISAAKGNDTYATQLARDELMAEIKAFGDSRVNAAVREMHRQYGLTLHHDDGLEVILARCKADAEVEERLNAANRALAAMRRQFDACGTELINRSDEPASANEVA